MNWSALFKIVAVETIIRVVGLFFCFFIPAEGGSQTVGMFALALIILFFVTTILEIILFCMSFLIFKKVNLSYKIIEVNLSVMIVIYAYNMGNMIEMSSFGVKLMLLLLFVFNVAAILSVGIFFKKI
ncbi:hypothetical protein [Emticicia sp. BO119]|uniref:hypothetical protein n=1 Tax=Emticicia sp. BO119 TaxID=2757768 RepID=UPI0015F0B907|nr:hypothetical protein [Emticicia sp. BO119]MBA4851081.1 hypothetical protein [Emticicia sp. BO119]